jgi:hypothetical protein
MAAVKLTAIQLTELHPAAMQLDANPGLKEALCVMRIAYCWNCLKVQICTHTRQNCKHVH